ncbi:ABC transporter permease [Microvirga sp. TS319]|uniref:ABC transporter permease n=1 Tax=Microvirga sp. TS319 TaxID=3241165 RepID=UPI00351A9C87
MTSGRPAPALAPARELSRPALIAGYLTQIHAVADAEIRKLMHDPSELLTRALQPAIWLLLFGQVMAQVRGITNGERYLDFLAPGILAQSVLFAAIFYGIAAIWERDLGVLHRYMVSPAPRSALVLGKAASSAMRGISQAVIVYALSVLIGISVSFAPLHLLGVALFIAIGSALFSTFSLIIACIVKTRERFMGIGQVLTMPIFFASNAIYPIELMPEWLKAVSSANPLTYEVDALRALMLADGTSRYGLGFDFAVLTTVTALLVAVAARMYPRLTA